MIFDWLFKRSKKSNNKEAVAPVFIDVPTREDLIKDGKTKELELLYQYKKEYKDKLNKRLLFGDISSENLSKKYLANQDIIIKHIMSNNYTGINEILASGSIEELLEAKLEYLKLYILNEENNKIHNEILLRYMALTEIKKKAYFIRPAQRRAISNELDFLHNSLVVCKSNNFATNTDCKLYLIRMNEINKYMNNLSDEENKLLNERKRLVTKLANTFIKDKYDSILSSNMSDLGIVSYLEIELEKYYLSHQEDFELYKLEVLPKTTISDKEDVKQLLEGMEELEAKYLLRNMFNKIDEYMFLRMYKLKFIILTHKISCFGNSVISKEDYGYEYYKKIVNEKLDFILNGYNENFNAAFASISGKSNAAKDYFISADEILNNMEKLSVLLSFDSATGFEDLLNNTLIKGNDYKTISLLGNQKYSFFYNTFFQSHYSYGILWNNYIPLKSILEIMQRKEFCIEYKPLTYLYHLSDLKYPYRQLPDGIIKLAPEEPVYTSFYRILPEPEPLKSEEFRLPRTIKEYDDAKIYCYYVNELPYGIEKITFHIDQHIPPIPPTVNEIKLLTYGYKRERSNENSLVLAFFDFRNSNFLRSKKKFVDLLNSLNEMMIYKRPGIKIKLYADGLIRTMTICKKLYYGDTFEVNESDDPDFLADKFSYYDDFDSIYDEKIKPKLNYVLDEEQVENKQKIKKNVYY